MGSSTSKEQRGYASLRKHASDRDRRLAQTLEDELFQPRDSMDFQTRQAFISSLPARVLSQYSLRFSIEAGEAAKLDNEEIIDLGDASIGVLAYLMSKIYHAREVNASPRIHVIVDHADIVYESPHRRRMLRLMSALLFLRYWGLTRLTVEARGPALRAREFIDEVLLNTRLCAHDMIASLFLSDALYEYARLGKLPETPDPGMWIINQPAPSPAGPGIFYLRIQPPETTLESANVGAMYYEEPRGIAAPRRVYLWQGESAAAGGMPDTIYYYPPLSINYLSGKIEDLDVAPPSTRPPELIGTGTYGNVYRLQSQPVALKKLGGAPWIANRGVVNELFAWQFLTRRDTEYRVVPILKTWVHKSTDLTNSVANAISVTMPLYHGTLADMFLTRAPPQPMHTLNKYVREMGQDVALHPMLEQLRIEIALQLASALAWMHAQGAVHFDFKPANILVKIGDDEPRGFAYEQFVAKCRVVLADFTFSNIFDDTVLEAHMKTLEPASAPKVLPPLKRITYSVGGVGTPGYISPEGHVRIPIPLSDTPKMDVFAYGVVLHFFLAPEHMKRQPLLPVMTDDYISLLGFGTRELYEHYVTQADAMVAELPKYTSNDTPRILRQQYLDVLTHVLIRLREWLLMLVEYASGDPRLDFTIQKQYKPNNLIAMLLNPDYRRRPPMEFVARQLAEMKASNETRWRKLRDLNIETKEAYQFLSHSRIHDKVSREEMAWWRLRVSTMKDTLQQKLEELKNK
jgi:serine/threonine protein kinase